VPLRLSIRAPVDDAESEALVSGRQREVEVSSDKGEVLLGRAADVTVQLPFPKVSLRHARLSCATDGYRIEDLGSRNGTWLAGRRLTSHLPEVVAMGEPIVLGGVRLCIEGEFTAPDAMPVLAGTESLARRLVHDLFEASPPAERACLVVLSGLGQGGKLLLAVSGRTYKVGRGEGCDLVLQDEDVSREHAAFDRGPEGVVVRDLGSKNGVEVAGAAVAGQRLLRDGEIIRVGQTRLRFLDPEERYLRQMEAADACRADAVAVPTPAAPAGCPAKPSPLPVIATAVAVTALLTSLGLVLALAFVVYL
jgi:pSer/pThr/pTyr-binding forkhead associated (FHA) protein